MHSVPAVQWVLVREFWQEGRYVCCRIWLAKLAQEEPGVPSTIRAVGIGIARSCACSRAWPGTTPAKVDSGYSVGQSSSTGAGTGALESGWTQIPAPSPPPWAVGLCSEPSPSPAMAPWQPPHTATLTRLCFPAKLQAQIFPESLRKPGTATCQTQWVLTAQHHGVMAKGTTRHRVTITGCPPAFPQ